MRGLIEDAHEVMLGKTIVGGGLATWNDIHVGAIINVAYSTIVVLSFMSCKELRTRLNK